MSHKNYTGIQAGGIFAFEYNQIQPLYFTEKLIRKTKRRRLSPNKEKEEKKEYPLGLSIPNMFHGKERLKHR